jgi:hypothetical protein
MAATKHQCIARLDELELNKLDVIRSASGLSRSGAIRRLIREFNLDGIDAKLPDGVGNQINNGQILEKVFNQLIVRRPHWVSFDLIRVGDHQRVVLNNADYSSTKVIGFVEYAPLVDPSDRDKYQYDIVYSIHDCLHKHTVLSCEDWNDETIEKYSQIKKHLQQIFVV